MADAISISGLRVQTHVGVTPEERAEPQEVLIDVTMLVDLRRAADSDALEDTVDYAKATTQVARVVEASRANLLEHLAGRVAEALLGMPGVVSVKVEIAKESVPVGENVHRIAVRIERP